MSHTHIRATPSQRQTRRVGERHSDNPLSLPGEASHRLRQYLLQMPSHAILFNEFRYLVSSWWSMKEWVVRVVFRSVSPP